MCRAGDVGGRGGKPGMKKNFLRNGIFRLTRPAIAPMMPVVFDMLVKTM